MKQSHRTAKHPLSISSEPFGLKIHYSSFSHEILAPDIFRFLKMDRSDVSNSHLPAHYYSFSVQSDIRPGLLETKQYWQKKLHSSVGTIVKSMMIFLYLLAKYLFFK